jgi:hypothetical protein
VRQRQIHLSAITGWSGVVRAQARGPGVSAEDVEPGLADVLPPHIQPFTVLWFETTADGVEVSAGTADQSPSPIQQTALDAIRA